MRLPMAARCQLHVVVWRRKWCAILETPVSGAGPEEWQLHGGRTGA